MRFLLAILFLLLAPPAHAQNMQQAVVVSSCGSQALTTGLQTNLTMNPQGQLCLNGIAAAGCQAATNYLARTSGENTAAMTALICGLVTDGVITGTLSGATGCGTYLDALYIMAQQNRTDAMLNLCGTSYPLTLVGSFSDVVSPKIMSFVSYVGFSNFAIGSLDTGFNAATAPSPKFTQNSASFGVWSYAVVSEALIQMGTNGLTSIIYDDYPGNIFYARVNFATSGSVPTTITKGLFAGDRSSAANVVPYQNGVAGTTQAGASQAPENSDFVLGLQSTAQTLSAAFISASLGAARQLAVYSRLRTYMTAVGVP